MQKKSEKLKIFSFVILLIVAPLIAIFGGLYFKSENYYITALMIVISGILPFFIYFDKRKIKTGELVLVAMMIAICVSSRAAFAFIPQVKPMCAFVVVTAIAFGSNVGFITGALSVLISNFFFGQGVYTPFQMLGMGLVGFFCGIIFYKKSFSQNKILVSVIGGVLCFLIYGICVDGCSCLIMQSEITLKGSIAIFTSGAVFNLIHGVTTAIVLFLINKPMNSKFSRLRIKYGIFDEEELTA